MFEKGVWISDDEVFLFENYFDQNNQAAYSFVLEQAKKRTIEIRGYGTSVIGGLFGKFTDPVGPAKKSKLFAFETPTRESYEEKEKNAKEYLAQHGKLSLAKETPIVYDQLVVDAEPQKPIRIDEYGNRIPWDEDSNGNKVATDTNEDGLQESEDPNPNPNGSPL